MPILFQINVVANWGSTGRIAEEIGQLAMANGWESYIAYGRGTPKSQSKLIRIGNDWDMYSHAIQTRLFDNHGLASKKTTLHLIEQIRKINPSLIHLHNIHGYFLNYKLLFQYLSNSNIPVVWTLHDCWPITGHCAYFMYVKCNRWINGCYKCPQISSYPQSLFHDRSRNNYKDKKLAFNSLKRMTLVPVSDWLANLLKKSFLQKYPIRKIYNGIDLNVFNPQNKENVRIREQLNITTQYMLLGVASVWDQRKGLNDFTLLREKLSDKYAIVLVGLTDKQIKKLPQGIIGVARTNSVNELAAYYTAADIFINPTWEDNFPTTNLEALACGTPVISYRTGGSVEAIDTDTGITVPPGDIQSLKEAIKTICGKNETYTKELCRNRAIRHYNKYERYAEYINLYHELLET